VCPLLEDVRPHCQ